MTAALLWLGSVLLFAESYLWVGTVLWLGGILLFAAPYLWACALCVVARDPPGATERPGPPPRQK